ncbi:MAG: hypothetical protein A2Y17_12145 [Clostridiales bacterium GWF2_38_85]|nr:MAG: hypothetical protein A2Y17_12145 [Clostridiales bacterium GWF2_38_85]
MTPIESMARRGRTPKVVLYARFSSDNQRDESIDAQLRAMHEYCSKLGAIIVTEYIDRAKSATTDDRPEFLHMIDDAKNEEFDFVIVHKLDRFSRNRYDSAHYRHELKKHGISLVSVIEQLDDSPEGIIMESVLEGMGEYYSKNLSREVMKGMKESALQGLATGGVAPFGLAIDTQTRKYIINEDEAPAVRFIFEQVSNGVGYTRIIQQLNEMGYRTRKGKLFGKNSIHEILRNEKYKGVFVFNRSQGKDCTGKRNNHYRKDEEEIIRIPGAIEPIVDENTFDAVTRIIASRRRATPINAKEVYLLAGKVYCGECGSAMTGNRKHAGRNKTLYVTYRCGGSHLKGRIDCKNKEISRDKLENFVMKELARVIFNDETLNNIIAEYQEFCARNNENGIQKIEVIQKKLQAVQGKIDNLIQLMAETGSKNVVLTLGKLEKEQEQLETELAKAEAELNYPTIDENKIRAAYKTAREQFLFGELPEKQLLINHYLNKVVVYKEHIEVFLNKLPTYLLTLDDGMFTARWGSPKNEESPTTEPQKGSVVSENGGGDGSLSEPLASPLKAAFSAAFSIKSIDTSLCVPL